MRREGKGEGREKMIVDGWLRGGCMINMDGKFAQSGLVLVTTGSTAVDCIYPTIPL